MTNLLENSTDELFHNEFNCDLTVADAVWLGTALIHYRNNVQTGESIPTEMIVAMVTELNLTNRLEKSVYLHVNQHCVANRPPNSNRTRMLFETGRGERRLFRGGDKYDPLREGTPTHPDWDKLPPKYLFLREWYENVWNGATATAANDPLLALIGAGAELWKNEPADQYVANLRANWGDRGLAKSSGTPINMSTCSKANPSSRSQPVHCDNG